MTVAPNTPTTTWIRDKGTVVSTSIGVLIDELGNFFIDESSDNLLDTVSSDGVIPAHEWDSIDKNTTSWSGDDKNTTQWGQDEY